MQTTALVFAVVAVACEASDRVPTDATQLAADDECGSRECGLSALQRRARVVARDYREANETQPDVSTPAPDEPNLTASCTPTLPHFSCWESRLCCDTSMGCFEKVPGLAYCMPGCVPGLHFDELPWAYWTCNRLDQPVHVKPGSCRASSCTRNVDTCYALDWKAEGKTFFDDFVFVSEDATHGGAKYLSQREAFAHGVVQATDSSASIRLGQRVGDKIESVNLHSKYTWSPKDSFLVAMKQQHVPYGCGVWPAFWTMDSSKDWPEGGELDIFEWTNTFTVVSTLHTGKKYPCFLDAIEGNKCIRQMDNNHLWECTSDYFPSAGPAKLGCAVNVMTQSNGEFYRDRHGVVAMEWTSSYIKIFQIPEQDIPQDLLNDEPRPAHWDRWLTSYYPFDEQDCPHRDELMGPQELVFNIQVCGDWAGGAWEQSMCPFVTGFFSATGRCKVDIWNASHDCCRQYIMSRGFDEVLKDAHWDMSWLKVYTDPWAPTRGTSATYHRGGATRCSAQYTNCQSSRCCEDPSMKCFVKNAEWAGCRKDCTAGIYEEDPIDVRTPWSCEVLNITT